MTDGWEVLARDRFTHAINCKEKSLATITKGWLLPSFYPEASRY
jgi:hypothetical protein